MHNSKGIVFAISNQKGGTSKLPIPLETWLDEFYAGATETHKYISDLLGKMTIDTLGDGKNGQNFSSNFSRQGRELMTPSEVKRIDRKHAIVFMEEERPVYDRKALPWEDKGKNSPFKAAMKLNENS